MDGELDLRVGKAHNLQLHKELSRFKFRAKALKCIFLNVENVLAFPKGIKKPTFPPEKRFVNFFIQG